ncbi:hypothetical protein X907_2862 [Glycocaulis alkaliphilus]|uniref:Uncharacterized protein n=1 Tax=Glycocaulis alkaliphilus TaxID=1434191 RepID=A0A3T0EDK5_9PROT|nr:hypothetical protein X907_2862 [Glycocaulis alkaliphilus]
MAKAGFSAGVIRAADDEAGRFVSLHIRRLFASFWFQTGASMVVVLATALFGARASNGFFGAVTTGLIVVFPLLLVVTMSWLSARQLHHESPERWAARQLVLRVAGGGEGALEKLKRMTARAEMASSTHGALRLIAEGEKKPRQSGKPDWTARAIIAGLIVVPILLVVAVPAILSRFGS